MRNRQPAVYLLASKKNGTLYVGVTSNLIKRIWEHKNNVVEGFTKKYAIHTWFGMKYMTPWNQLSPVKRQSKTGSENGKSAKSIKSILNGMIYTIIYFERHHD